MTDTRDVVVRMEHMRKARMCSRGVREFFVQHELDWSDFLKNGIPASRLAATGDAMALRVVEVARGQQ